MNGKAIICCVKHDSFWYQLYDVYAHFVSPAVTLNTSHAQTPVYPFHELAPLGSSDATGSICRV